MGRTTALTLFQLPPDTLSLDSRFTSVHQRNFSLVLRCSGILEVIGVHYVSVTSLSLSLLLCGVTFCFADQQRVAQAVGSPNAAQPSQAAQPTADDATLKKAAVAFPQIRKINQETNEALKETNNEEEQKQILAQAQSKQVTIVRSVGISVHQYNEVIQVVRSNPAVETKFASYVKAAAGDTQ